MNEEKNSNKRRSFLIVFIILIGILSWVFFLKTKNSKMLDVDFNGQTVKAMIDCTATKDTKVEKVVGWNTYLYPAQKVSPMPDPDKKIDLQEAYSLAKLLGKTEAGSIYYRIELADKSYLPRETKKILEICNEDNKTTEFNTTMTTKDSGASENVVASVGSIFSYFMPSKPGNYRVDAFIFANGKWTLTDRIEQIKIVD